MNYASYRNTALSILLLILCTALLIGRLTNARFAGGTGVEETVRAEFNAVEVRRGEIVRADSKAVLTIGATRVFLDTGTSVELVSLVESDPAIRVIEGRIVTEGPLAIKTRETVTKTQGVVSFVHYGWLDSVDIGILSGNAVFTTPESSREIALGGYKSSTLAPYEGTPIPFDPTGSSARLFYEWVAQSTPLPLE